MFFYNSLSDENNEPTNLIDLNDDCLYETFVYMDADALVNLAYSNSRFTSIARYYFPKKYDELVEM